MRGFAPILLALLAAGSATAQRDVVIQPIVPRKQVALVMGNGAYTHVGQLKNPVNDADAMARRLRELNFDVLLVKDAGRKEMGQKIDDFIGRLGTDDVAVFYYAGHGVQLEGENYLIPTDFEGDTEADVRYDSHAVGKIQERMERSGAQLNILILDACRSNPFRFGGRSGTRGWAAMNAGRGTFIAFATAPGSIASDDGAGNGLFTQYLLEALSRPGLGLSEVFDYVRARVDQASGGKQLPWAHSSVVGSYSFTGAAGQQLVASSSVETRKSAPPPARAEPIETAASTTPSPGQRTVGIGELKSSAGRLDALPQVWRNLATNDLYRLRFDPEHMLIYRLKDNQVVADLTLKRDKKDSKKDKYIGITLLSPCRGGGRMEVMNWSPTRIEATIEVPDAQNNCLGARFGILGTKVQAAFIPEEPR
jgi:hypothetical protein